MTATVTIAANKSHWLDRYAKNHHEWRPQQDQNGDSFWCRRQGIIESAFDADGRYYEGRADVTSLLRLKFISPLSWEQLRQRILLAWTALRLEHVLMRAWAPLIKNEAHGSDEPYFQVPCFDGPEAAIENANQWLSFVEDRPDRIVDDDEFHLHSINTARVVDTNRSLSRLFVLPRKALDNGETVLRFCLVAAHQITDGLTMRVWQESFLRLLNTPLSGLQTSISSLCPLAATKSRLPKAQEDLYPAMSGSVARRRWFWALSRILRHVRKPLSAGFPNPLRHEQPFSESKAYPPTYAEVLDYTSKPPLNTFVVRARVAPDAVSRMVSLCRQAGASVGAGGFALVAMVMMELHERRHPGDQRPFITAFPINPRPFFNHMDPPDSLMLAFCDGIVFPFLPSDLDRDGRFRVLVRHAQRQLSAFQKRVRPQDATDPVAYMGSRGAGRVIAMNYILSVEREELKLPDHLRKNTAGPQGMLAASMNGSSQTCGVSSVGRTTQKPGMYDLSRPIGKGEDDFVADWFDTQGSVRVRDGEFLCGVYGQHDGMEVVVSVDGNAIDEEKAEEFRQRIEIIFNDHSSRVTKSLL
ncbi:hypothetical protein BKA67DRAFT_538491 [Truncatella angustata]|uniref:Uncharacterized protein n=1 Tax=Truncatella angustata TaxID=152316 RepID=A0A9P8ZSM7_9PEZI|nr:uncharacterized protein BKA67DRAFT_538491 [Truncatella angustata]KAH6648455.1 hypothetical protein BKA67DRAFT_538491 [Truncatella angustata]KAH8201578.1 hypothetical protein TruAng_004270 [Truncatella angustata]